MAWISVITDEENSLTKHFSLDKEGKLQKSAPGHLVKGTIEAFDLDPVQLIEKIKGLSKNQCLCLGVLDTPETQEIFCGKLAQDGQPTRSKDHLNFFPSSSYLLLDFDDSGKSPEEAIEILAEIDPQFDSCGLAVIPSSSSYIYTEDGKQVIGEGNFHIFVPLSGDRDPNEYGNLLFEKLLLKGFCNPMVTKAGTIVVKSLFDKVVLSPEREIFSADPVCKKPLVSKRLDHVEWQEGPDLNSDLLPGVSGEQSMELRLKLKEIRESLESQANKVRQEYYVQLAKVKAKLTGTHYLKELPTIPDTPVLYDKQGRPILELLSNTEIYKEDGSTFFVRELLLDPQEGTKLPDPLEPFKRGDEARRIPGKGIATVLGNMIYSHNHCGMIYLLRWDISDVMEILAKGEAEEKEHLWGMLSTGAQELSASTTDADLSELADMFKLQLSNIKKLRMGKEKKHILSKLKPGKIPSIAEEDKILEMNAKYGVVNMGGKAVIVSERWNSSAEEFETEFSIPTSLDTLTKNIPMRIPGFSAPVSLYKFWEQHPDRRTYNDITFEPNAHTFRKPGQIRVLPDGDVYNLFQGYIYDPDAATSCQMILDHIKEVWCSGDLIDYEYTINWLAHLFQYPERLSQTALVLQSVPGAGKGIIIENCIVKPLGIHAMSTSNPEDVSGRFNLHLSMNIFFFANEMNFTAQNSLKSTLKTIVETETRTIEAKNVNRIKARNYSSLIFASNNQWVLNLDHGDRRYVYLTVSSHKVNDKEYFIRLKKCINEGGKDAFIKYLLARDISNFKANVIPNKKQKQRMADFLRSAHPSIRFVWSLFDTDFGVSHLASASGYKAVSTWQEARNEPLVLGKSQFFSLYREYCDYYRIERKYDDPGSMELQLEVGGVLKRESAPEEDDFIMKRIVKGGKTLYEIKPLNVGKGMLEV